MILLRQKSKKRKDEIWNNNAAGLIVLSLTGVVGVILLYLVKCENTLKMLGKGDSK